jgi:hypothetical protein
VSVLRERRRARASSALQRAKLRRRSAPGEQDPSEEAGELNVVPFLDIITNVMMFVLASLAITFTVTLTASAPRRSSVPIDKDPRDRSLGLTVIVGTDGYWVKGRTLALGTGCREGAGGVTIPRIASEDARDDGGRRYDVERLRRCLRQIKDGIEGAGQEKQLLLTAGPNVPFQEILRVMEVARGDDAGGCAARCPDAIDAKGTTTRRVCDRGACADACGELPSACSELFPDVAFTVMAGAR